MSITYSDLTEAQKLSRVEISAQIEALEEKKSTYENQKSTAVNEAQGTCTDEIAEIVAELTAKRTALSSIKPTITLS